MTNSPFPPGSLLAAYLRDSGGDEQDLSIDQQETAIRAWCAQNGCTLTRVFRDTRSGTSVAGRAGFEELIRYFFQKHQVPEVGIVLWRFNRFARDLDDAQFFKAGLRRRGYTIHSLQDPIPDGPAGKILEFFIDWMSDKYSEDLAVDIRRGLHQLIEQHGALGGRPPIGFKRQPVDLGAHRSGASHIVHRWVPDPDLWETCRLAWQMRAAGASYAEIHNRTGLFRTRSSFTTFFKNRIYLGELRYQDTIIPNYCEPLVDQATWDAVQAISARRTKNPNSETADHPRRARSPYLLSGLTICADCGGPLSGNTVNASAEGRRRTYYLCSRIKAWGCRAQRIPSANLEAVIINETINHILDPQRLLQIQEEQNRMRQEHAGEYRSRRAELITKLQSLRLRIHNTTQAIADAGHSKALLQSLQNLEQEEMQQKIELEQLEALLQSISSSITPQRLAKFARTLARILPIANLETKRRILHGLIHKIEVKRDGQTIHGTIYYYQPDLDQLYFDLQTFDPDLYTLTGLDPPPSYVYGTPHPRDAFHRHTKYAHSFQAEIQFQRKPRS